MRSDMITASPLDHFSRLAATLSRNALASRSKISAYLASSRSKSPLKCVLNTAFTKVA